MTAEAGVLPQVYCNRGDLRNTLQALSRGKLSLGFIGGSITEERPIEMGRRNWPEFVLRWFQESFPKVRIEVENSAIGGTGSDLAVFRAKRDLVDRGCNLVFVEFAVNDHGIDPSFRERTREGLLRRLLGAGETDVLLVYTHRADWNSVIEDGSIPSSIRDFEKLAEHYQLSSIWAGLEMYRQITQGPATWEELLPDGLHPTRAGSALYGECVIGLLQDELIPHACQEYSVQSLPESINPECWDEIGFVPFSEVQLSGKWLIRRWTHYSWNDQVLSSTIPGSRMKLSFVGRGLCFGFDFGSSSAEFQYRIDGGEWRPSNRKKLPEHPVAGWPQPYLVADNLRNERHEVEVEVLPGDSERNVFDLGFIGVLR